jgi:hypothetical protein
LNLLLFPNNEKEEEEEEEEEENTTTESPRLRVVALLGIISVLLPRGDA